MHVNMYGIGAAIALVETMILSSVRKQQVRDQSFDEPEMLKMLTMLVAIHKSHCGPSARCWSVLRMDCHWTYNHP